MNKPDKLDERRCTKCYKLQPNCNFHADNSRKSGYRSNCKKCVYIMHNNWYERNKKTKLAQNEQYRQTNWEKIKAQTYKRLDPKKHKARQAVNNAVTQGKIVKTDCQHCSNINTEFHHTNGYEQEDWFRGVWLCRPCHAKTHKELRWKTI